eukprot:scaffold157228_cov24-Prasinocladus_malaysianus.AAC.1
MDDSRIRNLTDQLAAHVDDFEQKHRVPIGAVASAREMCWGFIPTPASTPAHRWAASAAPARPASAGRPAAWRGQAGVFARRQPASALS